MIALTHSLYERHVLKLESTRLDDLKALLDPPTPPTPVPDSRLRRIGRLMYNRAPHARNSSQSGPGKRVKGGTMRTSLVICLAFVPALVSGQTTSAPAILEHHNIAQASIGQTGRERAYINCVNPDEVDALVTARVVGRGQTFRIVHHFTVNASDSASVDMLTIPFMPAVAYFSLTLYVAAADGQDSGVSCDLTWHRASDFAEVDNRPAVVRRSPKR